MHNEIDPTGFPSLDFEVERFDDDDDEDDTDCNATAVPAAVDDEVNGMDDETLLGMKLPKQCGHCSDWLLHDKLEMWLHLELLFVDELTYCCLRLLLLLI